MIPQHVVIKECWGSRQYGYTRPATSNTKQQTPQHPNYKKQAEGSETERGEDKCMHHKDMRYKGLYTHKITLTDARVLNSATDFTINSGDMDMDCIQ